MNESYSPQSKDTLGIITYSFKERIAYTVLAIAVGIVFAFMTYCSVYTFPEFSNWTTGKGTITKIVPLAKIDRALYYTYEVNGNTYTARQSFKFFGYYVNTGDSVKIRYNPELPSRSVIESGPTIVTYLWAGGCILALFICFSMLTDNTAKLPADDLGKV